MTTPSVEVAVPCMNEARTIGKVVGDFRRVLSAAAVVVYDNGSTDGSAEAARAAGAAVRKVTRLGKGFVVQAIFERSRADIVLMVDGDDTYAAEDAPALLAPLLAGDAEMVIGARRNPPKDTSVAQLHRWGNYALTQLLNAIFGTTCEDILSGYRGMSRRFIEQVPLVTCGFEIETELLVQSLELGLTTHEVPVRYRHRPPGSRSKLRAFHDGYRILMTMLILLRDHRPLLVFGWTGATLAVLGISVWIAGVVAHPAWRPAGVMLAVAAMATLLAGLILNTINTRFRELHSLVRRPRPTTADAPETPDTAGPS